MESNKILNVSQGFDHFQQENHTSQPGSAKLQANDDFGHFNAPQQNDDGDQFEQFGSAQPQDNVDHFGDQNQSSTQHQDGGDVYDDYFGGNNQQANSSNKYVSNLTIHCFIVQHLNKVDSEDQILVDIKETIEDSVENQL